VNDYLQYPLNIGFDEKHMEESVKAKSHGLQIDEHGSRKNHVSKMIPKSSGLCCTDQCSIPASVTLSKQLILPVFTAY
jgi:hypothetical protein